MNLSRPTPYIISTVPLADAQKAIRDAGSELPEDLPERDRALAIQGTVLMLLVCYVLYIQTLTPVEKGIHST